jgi:hypothetical protein
MRIYRLLFAVLLGAQLAACGDAGKATVLYYAEQDEGGKPYSTRLIVTPRWLRIDDGPEGRDFLLFDRRDRTIYNLNTADGSILVLPSLAIGISSPLALQNRVDKDAESFPAVGNRPVTHYRLHTNDKLCYDLYAAAELLPEAVQALREYRQALAGQQAVPLPSMPKELLAGCDLANNIFAPTRHLEHGLPVRVTEVGVRTSELVDFNADFEAPPALFELPADYARKTIEELRGS